jgi:hypothetical protein
MEKNMCLFFKRKNSSESAVQKTCHHLWKDFPLYYKASYYIDKELFDGTIYAPYVCVHCKERKNIVLYHQNTKCTLDQANEYIHSWKEEYRDYIQDSTLVEKSIADMQLLDTEKLSVYESIARPFYPCSGGEGII